MLTLALVWLATTISAIVASATGLKGPVCVCAVILPVAAAVALL